MDNDYQELVAEVELVHSTNGSFGLYEELREAYVQKNFYQRYPNIFIQKKFFRGIECGPGWFGLISDMCSKIDEICSANSGFNVHIELIKEKFGTMRVQGVWMHSTGCEEGDGDMLIEAHKGLSDLIWKVIRHADKQSSSTCDICGETGETRANGWIRTRCDRHAT